MALFALALAIQPAAVQAGPPFQTDDPEPTDTGRWEIYAPLFEVDGNGSDIDGSAGIEFNFGAAPDVQLTLAIPLVLSHGSGGWTVGAGDVEIAVKYRLLHDEKHGLQVAAFPGLSLPTATKGSGAGQVNALLPVWLQKDFGPWSVFGGAGYAIHPGPGNQNYWTGGIAVTRRIGENTLIGVEADRKGAVSVGGNGLTSFGIGIDQTLNKKLRILASAGPTIEDRTNVKAYHAFVALGWSM